ncbi:MAG: pyridoxal 5'-phosphate synthase glutaminase subunit PdxT [Candidatus Rokuibacteriota bacterium]|nr:MAG: pyridoxal 5'-phosphate synthase glutaminase subunit PdxT [Candidatus Rokubacteria bacterium]
MRIGVLALQGDFALHAKALARCRSAGRDRSTGEATPSIDVEAVLVRKPEELSGVGGLIIPGGESTTLLKLMDEWEFVPAIEKFHAAGKPIFGTCAGLIVLAREVDNPRQFSLGLIDVTVERNAYGRQRESFEAPGAVVLDGRAVPVRMVFIRAPRIRRVGAGVESLAEHGGETVMARQGSVLVATFHPELTDDTTVHRYFCDQVQHVTAAA